MTSTTATATATATTTTNTATTTTRTKTTITPTISSGSIKSSHGSHSINSSSNSGQLSDLSLYARYAVAGGTCCQLTHTVLVPLDVIKTRLQISTEYKGVLDAAMRIPRTEGLRALFLGLGPTFVGYSIQGAIKFGCFELFKKQAIGVLGVETAQQYSLPIYMASSTMAELLGTVALCPWEALRIRTVSQPEVYGHRGMLSSMRSIWSQEGFIHGFYRGLGPILAKQIPYTVTQLTVFSKCIDYLYGTVLPEHFGVTSRDELSAKQQLLASLGCGVVAGVASSYASHPADTILSRINVKSPRRHRHRHHQESPPSRTIVQIAKELGFRGIWLGAGTRAVMVSMLSAGMFLIYDSVKLAVGLPASKGICSGH